MPKRKYTEEELKEIEAMAGPDLGGAPPKLNVPLVRLNGKTGGFFRIADGEQIPIGNEIVITPLKGRRIFIFFQKERDGTTTRYFTSEHNSRYDIVDLFEVKQTDNKPVFLDTGRVQDLKVKYPKLKMIQVLYCLLNDEVVKLNIKGKSLQYWMDFTSWLATEGKKKSIYYEIKVSQKQEESALGPYFAMNFEIKKEVDDFSKVAEKILEIDKKIKEIDDFYLERKEMIAKEIESVAKEDEEVQTAEVDLPEKSREEINAELDAVANEELETNN